MLGSGVDLALLSPLDLMLRGGACALLVLIACLLLRDFGGIVAARLGAFFAVGAAAYTVCSAAGFHLAPDAWAVPVIALAAGNNLVFWLFAKSLFDDAFVPRWPHAALWTVIVGVALVERLILAPNHSAAAPPVAACLVLQALLFAFLAGFQALGSWREDLVEPRRRLRLFIVAAAAVHTAVTALSSLLGGSRAAAPASTFEACCLLAIAAIVTWSLLRVAADDALFAPRKLPRAEDHDAVSPLLDPADRGLIAALQRRMAFDRIYRQSGLSIGQLAQLHGVPEYKLRRLINQGLGYRNFSAFLNYYRLAEVKAALADPSQSGVPILTIALDAGFSSLGPFNRAFKIETGVTPTEFRRAALGSRPGELTIDRPVPASAGRISN
jgi:AraC-like DNA-binding protein